MYDYIKGTLAHKLEQHAVVENSGIGYRIATSGHSLQQVNTGTQVTFYTHLHVREDLFELYGFTTVEERATFELLLSVNGVGPKAALNILSCISAANLALAIVTNDAKAITAAQGVGAKMAQRIILDLKDKITNKDFLPQDDGFAPQAIGGNEAMAALMALGYSPSDAAAGLKGVPPELSVEDAIKYALKQLMRN